MLAAIRQRDATIQELLQTIEMIHTLRPIARMNHFAIASLLDKADARKALGLSPNSVARFVGA